MRGILLAAVFVVAQATQCLADEQIRRVELSCPRGDIISVEGLPPYGVDQTILDNFTTILIRHDSHDVTEFTVKEVIIDKSLPAPQISITEIKDLRDAPVRFPHHQEPGTLTLRDDIIVALPVNGYGDSYAVYGVSTKNPTVVSVATGSLSTHMWWAKCKSV